MHFVTNWFVDFFKLRIIIEISQFPLFCLFFEDLFIIETERESGS